MVKKAKYHAQKLTEEDKEILDKVAFKYAIWYYDLIKQYSNPKEYAEKVILKSLKSDTAVASLFTLTYLKNYPSTHIFKPGEINQKLANDIRKAFQKKYKEKRFLNPRDLRERVLEKLEKESIFIHLEGKKEVKIHQRKTLRPGRKLSSDTVHDDRGGRPSAYVVTEEVKKLKKAMDKPDALDYLYDKVVKSGLAHQLAKFQFLGFLYAAKMNEAVLHTLMGAGASFFQGTVNNEDTANFKIMHQKLQSFDDNQLDQIADDIAKLAVDDRGYYALLFMTGLLSISHDNSNFMYNISKNY